MKLSPASIHKRLVKAAKNGNTIALRELDMTQDEKAPTYAQWMTGLARALGGDPEKRDDYMKALESNFPKDISTSRNVKILKQAYKKIASNLLDEGFDEDEAETMLDEITRVVKNGSSSVSSVRSVSSFGSARSSGSSISNIFPEHINAKAPSSTRSATSAVSSLATPSSSGSYRQSRVWS